MIPTLPSPTESYCLSADLLGKGGMENIRMSLPDEAAREELVLSKLGVRAWGRLHHFRHYYSAGWGEHPRKPLSPRALETFFRFLEQVELSTKTTPSLFMTDNGGLELVWEDALDKSVQIEFGSQAIEYFSESRQIEGVVSLSDIPQVARELGIA